MKVLLSVVGTLFLLTSAVEAKTKSPNARGGVVSVVETDIAYRYVHVFTNANEVQAFVNISDKPLSLRFLAVGGGGSGGDGHSSTGNGGGGGGGGGVLETNGVSLAAGGQLDIRIGKGAKSSAAAGMTVLSNGTEEVACVPGGGNGSESTSSSTGTAATEGAAGGGGSRGKRDGAAGTYASSILGVVYSKNAGGDGAVPGGGGGGGAGTAGVNFSSGTTVGHSAGAKGGEGLASDITGELLVYGSGGGGGGNLDSAGGFNNGGVGGTRAGDSAYIVVTVGETSTVTNYVAATKPAANSGAGGGGGIGGQGTTSGMRNGTDGAEGIVVISYEVSKTPFAGGEISKIAQTGDVATFIHVFTNVTEAAQFVNTSDRPVAVRLLAVGGGGKAGNGGTSTGNGGAGGGGGGVMDTNDVVLAAGECWDICVGKGAASSSATAGATAISNDVGEIVCVPGGGNGSYSTAASSGTAATDGAAGGGGSRAKSTGGLGTYASSILGIVYPKNSGGRGSTYGGGGGGGARTAGVNFSNGATGGEGLASDITGETLVYGAGGGGGGNINELGEFNNGGVGGTRAGNAAYVNVIAGDESVTTNIVRATAPVANSGAGGGGGIGGKGTTSDAMRAGTAGAAGIVVIRYDWNVAPKKSGLILLVR